MPEFFEKTDILDSAYRLVILAAKRSKELQRGADPHIESAARKATTVAIQEIQQGAVDWEYTDRLPNGQMIAEAAK